MSVPKANTFYAVFVTFYPLRSWMGRFTVEVIFSRREDAPEVWSQIAPDGSGVIAEGSYRIGHLLGLGDKWWGLERDSFWGDGDARWVATGYDDPSRVIAEAIADVTRDVQTVLVRYQVGGSCPDAEPPGRRAARSRFVVAELRLRLKDPRFGGAARVATSL